MSFFCYDKTMKKTENHPSHYYTANPDLSHEIKQISYQLKDEQFTFFTDNGVFSKDKVDRGTDLLLKAVLQDFFANDLKPIHCLDFGCGYGVVSVVLGTLFPKQVWQGVDINQRAVALAKKNAQLHRLKYEYRQADGISELNQKFDLILLNPPIRTGKKVYYELFKQAAGRLAEDGCFYIVIQRKQGSDSAFKFLAGIFSEVMTIDKTGGYHTIRCRQPKGEI